MKHEPQTLLIDADDTLWENNIYFEAAFDEFVEFLEHSKLSAAEVRGILDEIELANSKVHGYGSLNFAKNLQECYAKLAEREVLEEDLERVKGFALRILERPVELIEGVAETLDELAGRHELILFTKGHPDEQRMKIDASGVGRWFADTVVVKEKNQAAYEGLVSGRGLEKRRTWMIGNSPKSDVNPALEAGLNAVFVPHERTWTLERRELRAPGPGRLVVVERFGDLRGLF
jgi:putative hydrolase of the HAD superfamily